MDHKIIKIFASVGGIAGLGLGVFLYLAKDIISVASQDLLELITLCAFGLAIVCLIVWAIVNFAQSSKSKQNIDSNGDHNQNNQTKVDGDHVTVLNIDTLTLQDGLVDQDKRDKLAKQIGVAEGILNSFYVSVGRENTSIEDWPKVLNEIANHYNELLAKVDKVEADADNDYLKDDIAPIRALIEQGGLDKARDVLDAIEKRDAQANDDDDQYVQKKLNQAKVQELYGDIEALDIRYEAAAKRYEKALNILNGSIGIDLQTQAIKEQIIAYAIAAGNYYHHAGLYDQALPLQEISVERAKHDLTSDHPTLATALNNLATLYRAQGLYDKAEPLCEQSMKIRKQNFGENHPDFATSLNNLALLYKAQGKYDKAEPLYQQSIEIDKQSLSHNHPDLASSLNNLASLYQAQGLYDKAESLYLQVIKMDKQSLGENHPDFAQSLNNLAELYREQRKYDEAEPLYLQSMKIRKQSLGENHPDFAQSLNNLALLYYAQGKYDEAEPLLEQALMIFKDKLPADHPNIKLVDGNLKILRGAMGKP